MAQWRNWSGSVTATPARVVRPKTLDEAQRLVAQADRVRVAGAGHSFMPLCETDGLLLELADLDTGIEIDPGGPTAWVPAGCPIHTLTQALWTRGYSLGNQGDIDRQAIAGATSTGTHGTGRTLGALSTFVRGLRLIDPEGRLVECDAGRDPELFQAARLGLGMIGVIVALKLEVVPAFRLRESLSRMRLDAVLERWDELTRAHRHVEFFVFPYSDQALLKTLDVVEEGDDPVVADPTQAVFQAACDLTAFAPGLAPTLQKLMTLGMGASTRAGPACRIFPSERDTRFEEMEGEVPEAAGPAALRAAIAEVRKRRFPIIFPFEFRVVAGDDLWLSPMNAGTCCSISFHQYAKMEWRQPFAAVEAVFRDHGARPHWAKRHTLTSDDVLSLYPRAARWGEVRRRFDPEGKFMNADLRRLFAFSLTDVEATVAA